MNRCRSDHKQQPEDQLSCTSGRDISQARYADFQPSMTGVRPIDVLSCGCAQELHAVVAGCQYDRVQNINHKVRTYFPMFWYRAAPFIDDRGSKDAASEVGVGKDGGRNEQDDVDEQDDGGARGTDMDSFYPLARRRIRTCVRTSSRSSGRVVLQKSTVWLTVRRVPAIIIIPFHLTRFLLTYMSNRAIFRSFENLRRCPSPHCGIASLSEKKKNV